MQVLISTLLGNTAVALALALAALIAMKVRHPAVAHLLWLLVIIKLLTPPVWRVEVVEEAARVGVAPSRVVAEATTPAAPAMADASPPVVYAVPSTAPPQSASIETIPTPRVTSLAPASQSSTAVASVCVPCILGWLWVTGSLAWVTLSALRIARFRRLLRDAREADDDLRDEVATVARRFGIKRLPDIRLIDAAVSPMIWFVGGRVKLILPKQLATNLSAPQRAGVIAHELAHVKRRDHWVRLLEIVATAVLWWHPLLWLARRGLRAAEEQCCDAWVVALLPGERRRYADALVDVLQLLAARGPNLPVTATGFGRIDNLRRRLIMILTQTPPKSLSRTGKIAVAILVVGLMPLLPVRGQAEPAEAPVPAAAPARGASAPAQAEAASASVSQPAGQDEATRRAVEALLDRAVQDADDHVRNAALGAIRQFGPRAIPALLDAMSNERTAGAARGVLVALGPTALDALVDALASPDAQVRKETLNTMSQILSATYTAQMMPQHGYAGPGVPGSFGGYGGGLRPGAPGMEAAGMEIEGLGGLTFGLEIDPAGGTLKLPAPVARMIAPVTRAAGDDDVTVRRAAIQLMSHLAIIASLTKTLDQLMPALVAALKDADADVRADAIAALAFAGPEAAAATPALAEALRDKNDRVRSSALMTLRAIGPAAREATPAIIEALKDPQSSIRAAAAEALGALQAPPPPPPPAQQPFAADPAMAPTPTPTPAPTQPPPPAQAPGIAPVPGPAPARVPPMQRTPSSRREATPVPAH